MLDKGVVEWTIRPPTLLKLSPLTSWSITPPNDDYVYAVTSKTDPSPNYLLIDPVLEYLPIKEGTHPRKEGQATSEQLYLVA